MQKLIVLSAGLLAFAGMTGPAAAAAKEKAPAPACDAKYYSDLVGKDVSETRSISGVTYRLVPAGADPTDARPNRITIRYDKKSNQILDVACG